MNSTLFVLAGASLALACAGELEGDPNEYIGAYGGVQPSAGSGNPNTAGTGGGGPTGGAPGGGAPSGGNGGGVVPPDPACVAMVFETNFCTACHSAASKQGGFDLTGPELGKRFSTLPAQYMVPSGEAAMCDKGALIIQPDNPSRSVLLKKVKKMETCGDPMPMAGSLKPADLTCIENWVNSFGTSANEITLDEGSGTGGSTF